MHFRDGQISSYMPFCFFVQIGVERAVLVECGQHDAPESVQVAKAAIRRFLLGNSVQQQLEVQSTPTPLRIQDGMLVKKGFR